MGRLYSQVDYAWNALQQRYVNGHQRSIIFNSSSQITKETLTTLKNNNDTVRTISVYDYGTKNTASYALGSPKTVTTTTRINFTAASEVTSRTTNIYDYHNGAVQDRIIYDSDIHDSSNAIHNTYFNYHEVAGTTHLDFVDVVDGNAHRIKYNTDINGQIVNRGTYNHPNNSSNNSPAGSYKIDGPHEHYYRFAGREMGETGNNGTLNVDYEESIALRQQEAADNPGLFRFGQTYGSTHVDFDKNYKATNSFSQGGRVLRLILVKFHL